MDIFLISNMYPDELSPGYGVFVKNMVEGLAKDGIHTKFSSLIRGKSPNVINKIFKYLKFYFSICINFFKKYDLIYIHFPNHSLPILLPLLAFRKRIIIVNLHGEDLLYSGFLGTILGKLNDSFLPKVNKIIVPSQYFKSELLKRCLCDESKIFISPSGGINNNLFQPLVKNYTENKICLGYVGRIEEDKGIKEFVEVVSVLSKIIQCKAYIIGYGTYENELDKLISKLDLTKNIKIIKGVAQEKLSEYYNLFDLFLFLSNRNAESLGLVGIESMACGTPVVGTDVGGIPSYLINEYNGFSVNRAISVEMIVKGILSYVAMDVKEKKMMRENCLSTARMYFRDEVNTKLSKAFFEVNTDLS